MRWKKIKITGSWEDQSYPDQFIKGDRIRFYYRKGYKTNKLLEIRAVVDGEYIVCRTIRARWYVLEWIYGVWLGQKSGTCWIERRM